MRYSLLSRFQGAFLGAALGEELGHFCWTQRSPHNIPTALPWKLNNWRPGLQSSSVGVSTVVELPRCYWGQQAIAFAEELIQSGTWKGKVMSGLGDREDRQGQTSVTSAQLSVAALPIALFFHENPPKLRQQLCHVAREWEGGLSEQVELLVVGTAIAHALREQLDPSRLLPQIIMGLQQELPQDVETNAVVIATLEQVQRLLEQKATLPTALTRLSQVATVPGHEAIAMAFFCFLSTSEDWHLSVVRAARVAHSPHILCALTGALAGAYNSVAGIPLEWMLQTSAAQQVLGWGLSRSALGRLADRLFAAWSGAYDPNTFVSDAAIAAPNVIRAR